MSKSESPLRKNKSQYHKRIKGMRKGKRKQFKKGTNPKFLRTRHRERRDILRQQL